MAYSPLRYFPTRRADASHPLRRAWRHIVALSLHLGRSVGFSPGLGGRNAAKKRTRTRRSHAYYVARATVAGLQGLYEPTTI